MIALLLAAVLASAPVLPVDPNPTTGVANPAVTQDTIAQTICVDGWSKTVRPPASYTNRLKAEMLPPGTDLHDFELDHVWPIEAGGDPRNPDNLRPQLWTGPDGAHAKDPIENSVHRAVCSGSMTLAEGHAALAAWITAHHPYPIIQTPK